MIISPMGRAGFTTIPCSLETNVQLDLHADFALVLSSSNEKLALKSLICTEAAEHNTVSDMW